MWYVLTSIISGFAAIVLWVSLPHVFRNSSNSSNSTLWDTKLVAVPGIRHPLREFRHSLGDLPTGFSWKVTLKDADTPRPVLSLAVVNDINPNRLPLKVHSWEIPLHESGELNQETWVRIYERYPIIIGGIWYSFVHRHMDQINEETQNILLSREAYGSSTITEYVK